MQAGACRGVLRIIILYLCVWVDSYLRICCLFVRVFVFDLYLYFVCITGPVILRRDSHAGRWLPRGVTDNHIVFVCLGRFLFAYLLSFCSCICI